VNDVERWIYLDGPEPERLRPLLDALRDLPPATPRARERAALRFFTTLDATLEPAEAPPEPPEPITEPWARGAAPTTPRTVTGDPTVRSPAPLPLPPSPPPAPTPPLVEARGAAPTPPRARAPEPIKSTALALEVPPELREQQGRLPFRPAPPGQPAKVRTLQAPVMPRRGHGETAPVGDDAIARAVAALPFAPTPAGASAVAVPRLTLQAYASLRAELAVHPEQRADLLRRYLVPTEGALLALDEHWRQHLAAHPEARAQFARNLAEFTAWLRLQRR